MAIIKGNGRDNTLVGTSAPDDLRGRGGDDLLRGLDADDRLSGARGDDTLEGGRGQDKLLGGSGNDVLRGGDGDDRVKGQPGADHMEGGDGDDNMSGGSGADEIFGGDGDDTLDGSTGQDILDGGEGDDVLKGGPQRDQLFGRNGDDVLVAGGGGGEIFGGPGRDTLEGGGAADFLDGGFDNDVIEGEGGNDTIEGGGGIDTAVYRGKRDDHKIIETDDGIIVEDLVTSTPPPDPDDPDAEEPEKEFNDGVDLLTNVERLQFTDILTGPDGKNGLPDAGPDLVLTISRNAPQTGLVIAPPTDPDGNSLRIRIVETPEPFGGTVFRPDSKDLSEDVPVELGERIDVAELVRTSFAPAIDFVGNAGAFSYEVDDGRGGTVVRRIEFDVEAPPAGVLALANLSGNDGFVIEGASRDDESGIAVGSSDLDGDGHPEIVVGARSADPSESASGRSYALFGNQERPFARSIDLGTLGPSQVVLIDGEAEGDRSGIAVGSAGDLDGDGFEDVVIGARGSDRPADKGGAVYVLYGDDTPETRVRLDELEEGQGSALGSAIASEILGTRVSPAGDLNADGLGDALFGAPGTDPPVTEPPTPQIAGHTYVLFGATQRLAAETAPEPPALLRVVGVNSRDLAGIAIGAAGDVDGDGFADFLIGAPGADPNGSGSGAAYLVFGGPDLDGLDVLNLAEPGEQRVLVLEGGVIGDATGTAVAGAGDVNGDGFDDMLIGAPGADFLGSDTGVVYVVYGDANLDSESPFSLITLDGVEGIIVRGEVPGDMLGTAVAGIGDIDGDGLDDVVLGARDAQRDLGEETGAAYVVFGAEELGDRGSIDLFRMSADQGLRAYGVEQGDRTGISLAGLGDFDGDGLSDFAIGASSANARNIRATGKTYVVLGGDYRDNVFSKGTPEDDILAGTGAPESFVAGLGADIVAPGGGGDVVYTGAGDDLIMLTSTDFVRIDGGSGFDTLRLIREEHLDLTASPRGSVRNVEIFDLQAAGSSLVLDEVAAANLSPATNETLVFGREGTTLELSGDWSEQSSLVREDVTFQVFESGLLRVLAEEGVVVEQTAVSPLASAAPVGEAAVLLASPIDAVLSACLLLAVLVRGARSIVRTRFVSSV